MRDEVGHATDRCSLVQRGGAIEQLLSSLRHARILFSSTLARSSKDTNLACNDDGVASAFLATDMHLSSY